MAASWFMSRIRGLAALSVPGCAGLAMSRALLCPTPDWPALSVACSKLSSSVNPGKSLSKDLCPTSSKILVACLSGRIV